MLLRKIDAAKKLGCSPANVTKLTKVGKLDVVGGRVTVESVERYLENRDPARAEMGRVMKPNAPLARPSGAPRPPAAPVTAPAKRTAGAQMTKEGLVMVQAGAVKMQADARLAEIKANKLESETVSKPDALELAELMARALRIAIAVMIDRLEAALPDNPTQRQREGISRLARSALDAIATAVAVEGDHPAPAVADAFRKLAA